METAVSSTTLCELVPRSIQAVDVEAVAVTVTELVSYALTLNSNNQSWLITQADIYFGKEKMDSLPNSASTKHCCSIPFCASRA